MFPKKMFPKNRPKRSFRASTLSPSAAERLHAISSPFPIRPYAWLARVLTGEQPILGLDCLQLAASPPRCLAQLAMAAADAPCQGLCSSIIGASWRASVGQRRLMTTSSFGLTCLVRVKSFTDLCWSLAQRPGAGYTGVVSAVMRTAVGGSLKWF